MRRILQGFNTKYINGDRMSLIILSSFFVAFVIFMSGCGDDPESKTKDNGEAIAENTEEAAEQ